MTSERINGRAVNMGNDNRLVNIADKNIPEELLFINIPTTGIINYPQ